MPDWIAAILLGLIEGITEFLPISSTGHLLLFEQMFGIKAGDLYLIVIQSGAVLAVIPLFWTRLQQFACNWHSRDTRAYLLKLSVAFVITGIGGLLLEKANFKLPDTPLPIALALLIGGALFLLIERWLQGRPLSNNITWTIAIAVGLGQLLAAVFPGASRSGTTILVMLALGLNRPLATEFSFLVGIPTMLAAGGLRIFRALHNPPPGAEPENWPMVALAFVVSAIVSFVVVKWLLRYVQTHTFSGFGWYRIALGILIIVAVVARQ
ncbi:MAG TPA: undecaprenyl-diphosphate phosphatase [Verrucomicrobiota bacterium]|nr:undecaprenyl-diphosphate phosphatase [Verrucomicrobiota bacterium]